MKLKFGDILISVALIVISLIFMYLFNKSGDTVFIEADGKTVASFKLSDDIRYHYTGDYENTIVIKGGKVYIESSNCPDKTCVHSGYIASGDKVICCLPNRLVIRIASDKNKADVVAG